MYIMPTAWNNKIDSNIPKIGICIPYNGNWNPEWVDRIHTFTI